MIENIGNILRDYRLENNYSQQQLADKLFVSRASVASWETGRRIPDIIILTRIARLLNLDMSVLTNASGAEFLPPEVIVVDDEEALLAGAIPVLSRVMPDANITGFIKASEAIDYTLKNQVDIVFLDIELGRTSGLDLCSTLTEINPLINVIFLTAYPDYAIDAWGTSACGFLLKPLKEEDVRTQLMKLRHHPGIITGSSDGSEADTDE